MGELAKDTTAITPYTKEDEPLDSDGAAAGGDAPCFLDQLADDGTIADVCSLVRLQPQEAPGPEWQAIVQSDDTQSGAISLSILMPRQEESLSAYVSRLQEPEARTLAWQVALLTVDSPVTLLVPGGDAEAPYVTALVQYIRELIR